MTTPKRARARTESAQEHYRAEVAAYVAAGGDESVQRVITAVHGLARKLDQWYDRQLADLDLSHGEWSVLARLATVPEGAALTPSQLADATNVARVLDDAPPGPDEPSAASSRRATDPDNRTRILVALTEGGWETFRAATQESNMVETDVLGRLTTDQRQELASLLEIVIAGLDEEAPA